MQMVLWLQFLCDTSSDSAVRLSALFTDRWIEVIQQAEQYQLGPLLYHRICALKLEASLPSDAQQRLRHHHLIEAARCLLRERELGTVLRTLNDVGVTPVLFKGAALAYTVYPDPICRPMGDVDLWISQSDMPRAQSALERCGYVQHHKPNRPLALQAQYYGEIQMFGTHKHQGLIELHWGVFPGEWLRRTASVEHDAIWQRLVPVQVAGQAALTLAPEDNLLQLAVHQAVSHQMASPYLRTLVDVVWSARQRPVDWNIVVERAQAWNIRTVTWLVSRLSADMVGLHEAEPALARLAPSPLRRWLLGCLVNPRALLAQRDITTSPLRFVYLLLLIDHLSDAVRLFGRALWPESDWLVCRYGRDGLATRLNHLAGALIGKI